MTVHPLIHAIQLRNKATKTGASRLMLERLDARVQELAEGVMSRFAKTDEHFPAYSALSNGEDIP